jgi:succinoglycan biosynthesis transport protein ExoP
MSPGGADALKTAVRRSLPIIIGLIVLGVVAVNLFDHLQGAKYQASAKVEVSTTSLAQIVTGVTPPFADPTEIQTTAQTLAGSPEVYRLAAQQTSGRFGNADTLENATSVSAVSNTDLLQFNATASTGAAAVGIANAAATGYTTYRSQLVAGQIGSTISHLQATLSTLPSSGAQRTQIQGEIARLQLLQGASSTEAQVVQQAVSASQTSPNTKKDSLIGFAVGLVIGLLLVALREAIDTKVRSESDVEELLAAPVLASVRTLPRRAQIVTLGRYEALFADVYGLIAAQLATDRRESEHSVIAITSAMAGEGKTTTAANLAVSLALRGQSVLLADLDFHKPTLADLFEVPPGVSGALQVLEGTDVIEDTLWEISLDGPKPTAMWRADPEFDERRKQTTPVSNGRAAGRGTLMVLPSGKSSTVDARGRTARLGKLLRELSSHADIVILDTPPALLTVEMTELAQLVDMVLVVVRQGRVPQRTLRSLGRHARTWPAELAGAVLTDVAATRTYASYYGGR